MKYTKPNLFCYRVAQAVSWVAATVVFRRRVLRNEIRDKKGAFVVIANHQSQLDFVNLIGLTRRPMSFVISNSFYQSLPIHGFLTKLGVIPKQQFQTAVKDLRRMKYVISEGQPLVIYPAGLMCEDGLSTPIPSATYKFLKWLDADVYVARCAGTYFAMPKWAKGVRPGRTYMDVYQLFDREELARLDLRTIQERTDAALLFDAYREQEQHRVTYCNNEDVSGLEQVLYMCPHCHTEFSVEVRGRGVLGCSSCGYEQTSDRYGFFHNQKGLGREVRYVSDWSRLIYEHLREKVHSGEETTLSAKARFHMIDPKKHKFADLGFGTISLYPDRFVLSGEICGQQMQREVSIAAVPSLPFSPGKYLEIQDGDSIYRCVLDDGKLVMKFINLVKVFHECRRECL